MYVKSKDAKSNSVTLCENAELYNDTVHIHKLNFIPFDRLSSPMRVDAKLRSRHDAAPATAEQTGDDSLVLRFDRPQRAIAPGQWAALYDGDTVIGGGEII